MILKYNLSLPSAVTIVTHSSIQSHKLVLLHKIKEDENNKNNEKKIREKWDTDGRIDEKTKGKIGRRWKNRRKKKTERKGANGK